MRHLACLLLLGGAVRADAELDALVERLASETALVRYEAARALGAKGAEAKRALRALLEALTDEEPWVRHEAGRALVRIGARKKDVPVLIRRIATADNEVARMLAEALAGVGAPAVPALREALRADDVRTRLRAVTALQFAGRHAAEALPDLIDLMRHKDAALRRQASVAVRRLGPWGAAFVPELLDRLRGADDQARWVAAQVLGLIGPAAREAIPALKEMREAESERMKDVASQALRRIDVAARERKEHAALRQPALAKEQAPAVFRAKFETTKGEFVVEVHRKWAPHGADRFFNLVRIGYFDDTAFFRVKKGFVVQFGLSGDSRVNSVWKDAQIPDDEVKETNVRGTLTYAKAGPKTRTTQVFVNLGDNRGLDGQGFAPFGRVVNGLKVLDSLYDGYGDMRPYGEGPDQRGILSMGNAYLKRQFPKLDYIERATLPDKR
ncbi:MAG: HEAT repeat domain-containing protein [Planctomycetota bacterium]|jgi:peptidyl-prolyl cis-trans isomerase A (cyclophilin A)